MPDKHEVGGSSPLGPTSRTKQGNEPFKSVSGFSRAWREISFKGGSSPLGPTMKVKLIFFLILLSNKTEKTTNHLYGGVAQLGEHLPCKQGVMGSNPIISTK